MKGQGKIDEFAFVLLAGVILIAMLMVVWTTPSEFAPKISPTTKSITAMPGSSTSFVVNVTGPKITNVTMSATGFASSWISFSDNSFNVPKSTLVTVYVNVPSGIAVGSYTGTITVTSTGGSANMHLTINVQNPGSINFAKRSVALGDFSINFLSDAKTLDSQSNVQVSKGAFSENKLSLVGMLDDTEVSQASDARIQLVISDTNDQGDLVVNFNGKELYNQHASIGQLTIPLNVSDLSTSNVARISTTSPGWAFWSTSTYNIRSASMVVNSNGATSKTVNVNLNPNEMVNFDHFTISSLVSYKPPIPSLKIKVNDQISYFGSVPITALNIDLKRDILGNPLIIGENNTMTFSFDKNGAMDFTNTILTINSLP
ncbi:hypothetical protein EPN87_04345 [archaeon]|nr:MAG: hypothetical protein EPN87_04345 [archaeon]